VRGSAKVLEEMEKQLGIRAGETTPDMEFTLEIVACIGACALAPTMTVDDETFGKMTTKKVAEVLGDIKKGTDKKRGIYICQGTGCVSGKSLEITEALKKAIAEKNLTDIEVGFTGCRGFCEQGPVAIVQPEDIFYAHVTVADVPDIV